MSSNDKAPRKSMEERLRESMSGAKTSVWKLLVWRWSTAAMPSALKNAIILLITFFQRTSPENT